MGLHWRENRYVHDVSSFMSIAQHIAIHYVYIIIYMIIYIYIITHIYIYVFDIRTVLKVRVKNYDCEDHSWRLSDPHEFNSFSFFKSLPKLRYHESSSNTHFARISFRKKRAKIKVRFGGWPSKPYKSKPNKQ